MANVKVVRFFTGEDVLLDLETNNPEHITFVNGIVIIPTANEQVTFTPYSPFSIKKESITVSKDKVVFIATPEEDLVEHYNTVFGNIVAPKKEIFTG